jgi:hypothetical protein
VEKLRGGGVGGGTVGYMAVRPLRGGYHAGFFAGSYRIVASDTIIAVIFIPLAANAERF